MSKPVIVQSDNTLLLEVQNSVFEEARDAISPFAELEKSPEHMHSYKISHLSLWNAASSGLKYMDIIRRLKRYSRYEIPQNVKSHIKEQMRRYGLLKLIKKGKNLLLVSKDFLLLNQFLSNRNIKKFIESRVDENSLKIKSHSRGHIKQALIKTGFPVEDLAGYEKGEDFALSLRETALSGEPFQIRDYQKSAIDAFYKGGGPEGGSGVLILPCGAGKTIIGMGVMAEVKTATLILVTNTIALRQWRNELIDKTDINPDQIGEFSGEKKEIKPVTIASYNIITFRKEKGGDFTHFNLFDSKKWGLVIYDEVHLLPAPVFRISSEIQSKRRLGLTATLVREDNMETDVFSLIGPKKYDMPWKVLEKLNWIAEATCTEIRIKLSRKLKIEYSAATEKEKFRLASENEEKLNILKKIINFHKNANIIIIGQYVDQLKHISDEFNFPLITGKTPVSLRENLYRKFRLGELKILIVSKVANFSIDLPDANVAVQVSGTFGSRQEEAQRLGRILRPKKGQNKASFYSIISSNTVEEKFAHNRQLFLTEQGYAYTILDEKSFQDFISSPSSCN